jgi:hypothetical protein
MSEWLLRALQNSATSKLNTRVRFLSSAPSSKNFLKQAPLLIEITVGIRIFARNIVQHFVQQNVQHDRARMPDFLTRRNGTWHSHVESRRSLLISIAVES